MLTAYNVHKQSSNKTVVINAVGMFAVLDAIIVAELGETMQFWGPRRIEGDHSSPIVVGLIGGKKLYVDDSLPNYWSVEALGDKYIIQPQPESEPLSKGQKKNQLPQLGILKIK